MLQHRLHLRMLKTNSPSKSDQNSEITEFSTGNLEKKMWTKLSNFQLWTVVLTNSHNVYTQEHLEKICNVVNLDYVIKLLIQ